MAKPKKWLSQNFLIDRNIQNKIFSSLNAENKNVIEIGPGKGALTKFLAKKSKKLTAYEIDKTLCNFLKKLFRNKKNVTIKNLDFLKSSFNEENEKILVVGNIPYHITSKILFHLFKNFKYIKCFYGMIQLEVAKKIIASPKTSNYGKLSVTSQFFGKCEILFNVKRESFYPKPSVDSAFIKILFFEKLYVKDVFGFLEFIKKSFFFPRKKLINNWKLFFKIENIKKIYEEFFLDKNVRPQEISVNLYIKMYNFFSSKINNEIIKKNTRK